MAKLNLRQQRFVDAYLLDPNATKAAIAAGYSEKTAGSQGHDLLKHPEIADAIELRTTKAIAVTDTSVERILLELEALGFSNLTQILDATGQLLPVNQWPREIAICIASMEFDTETGRLSKIRLWSKTQALALLAQFRKMVGAGDTIPGEVRQVFVGLAVTVAPGATLNVQQVVAGSGDKGEG